MTNNDMTLLRQQIRIRSTRKGIPSDRPHPPPTYALSSGDSKSYSTVECINHWPDMTRRWALRGFGGVVVVEMRHVHPSPSGRFSPLRCACARLLADWARKSPPHARRTMMIGRRRYELTAVRVCMLAFLGVGGGGFTAVAERDSDIGKTTRMVCITLAFSRTNCRARASMSSCNWQVFGWQFEEIKWHRHWKNCNW